MRTLMILAENEQTDWWLLVVGGLVLLFILLYITSVALFFLFFFLLFLNDDHKRQQGFLCLALGTGQSTARMASSKTVFKPFCVRALHSKYFTAPTSFAIAKPCQSITDSCYINIVRHWNISRRVDVTCGYVMGDSFLSFNFSTVSLSSRRSSLVPTRIMGVFGQWWRTSGYHWNKK